MPRSHDKLSAIRRPEDRQALREQGFSILDDVWWEIGKDQDRGIDRLVEAAGLDRSGLVRDLLDSTFREAGEKGASWPRRHALDLLIAAAALLLVGLVAWAASRAQAVGIALRDLRAGERVSTETLHGADPSRLSDRRLTREVPQGGYVGPDSLAPVPAMEEQRLRGRYRMSLQIRREDLRLLPSLPGLASLAVSASTEGPPQALLLRDVPVLSAEPSGDKANLDAAFTGAELQALLPLLPGAEVRVLRSLP
ncbi:MAG TPA: hypothetical protein VGG03_23780 [Thermoanaerobaculia bacterium]|jgi:hypothetical protein